MKNPISSWTVEMVEQWRKKSACIDGPDRPMFYVFTNAERLQALLKLRSLYPDGRVYPVFAERILYLSELY